MVMLADLLITTNLLFTPAWLAPKVPSLESAVLAEQTAPNAPLWREQAETLAAENQRLQDEIERLKGELATVWQPFEVTAYTAGYESTQKQVGEVGYGITASGAQVTEGRTIACPPSLPFGTVVEIDGVGERICEDRGGAITEGHIDVYVADLNEAQAFGRQKRFARIIREAE